jgi:hypothetical protein
LCPYLARTDDSDPAWGQGGSISSLDSYLEYTFATPGTYYIEVGSCCSSPGQPTNPVWAGTSYTLQVSIESTGPQTKEECKKNGWKNFENPDGSPMFKNQGDCVSYVATHGKNEPGQNVPGPGHPQPEKVPNAD